MYRLLLGKIYESTVTHPRHRFCRATSERLKSTYERYSDLGEVCLFTSQNLWRLSRSWNVEKNLDIQTLSCAEAAVNIHSYCLLFIKEWLCKRQSVKAVVSRPKTQIKLFKVGVLGDASPGSVQFFLTKLNSSS